MLYLHSESYFFQLASISSLVQLSYKWHYNIILIQFMCAEW